MKKFKYIDRDSGELYYGDVAISDVPNLNDKIVNYDSHIGNNDIHVTSSNKTTWNNHVADGVIHVTSGDKTTWNNHIADNVRHITSAERALWNSNSGGLKPFTNCFYVDANFTNSSPYFNNLTDAINSATNTTLIIVNGTFNMPTTIAPSATILNLISAEPKGSRLRFPTVFNRTINEVWYFYDFELIDRASGVGTSSITGNASFNFINCNLANIDFSTGSVFANKTNLNFCRFASCVSAKIENCDSATVAFDACSDVVLINISQLNSDQIHSLVKNCATFRCRNCNFFGVSNNEDNYYFDLVATPTTVNAFYNCVLLGSTDSRIKMIRINETASNANKLLLDNTVVSGYSSMELIVGNGDIYARNSLIVGTCSANVEGDLSQGSRSYMEFR